MAFKAILRYADGGRGKDVFFFFSFPFFLLSVASLQFCISHGLAVTKKLLSLSKKTVRCVSPILSW